MAWQTPGIADGLRITDLTADLRLPALLSTTAARVFLLVGGGKNSGKAKTWLRLHFIRVDMGAVTTEKLRSALHFFRVSLQGSHGEPIVFMAAGTSVDWVAWPMAWKIMNARDATVRGENILAL